MKLFNFEIVVNYIIFLIFQLPNLNPSDDVLELDFHPKVTVLNPCFDYVPPELITLFIFNTWVYYFLKLNIFFCWFLISIIKVLPIHRLTCIDCYVKFTRLMKISYRENEQILFINLIGLIKNQINNFFLLFLIINSNYWIDIYSLKIIHNYLH